MSGKKVVLKVNPKTVAGRRKPRPEFIPPIAILMEAIVMGIGAYKYGPHNWNETPIEATPYYSAAMRHLLLWMAGEDNDDETGVSHWASVRSCGGIIIDAMSQGNMIDNRPKNPALIALMKAYIDEEAAKARV